MLTLVFFNIHNFFIMTNFIPPEQPLLSLWRVLRGQIRALTDPAHPREEPGGQRQDPVRKDCRLKILCFPTRINLAGMGIGDGWMSPYHNARYAKFLYQVISNQALTIFCPLKDWCSSLTRRLDLWMSGILTTVCLKSKPLKI